MKKRKLVGILLAVLTVVTFFYFKDKFAYGDFRYYIYQYATLAEAFLCIWCFVPYKKVENLQKNKEKKLSKRTLLSLIFTLIAIPVTIFAGIYLLGDRKYYFISLMIIFETIIPFAVSFEDKKPSSRELVIISVLCALGVAGRCAFVGLPQFKPVLALVIISGVCFGGETGFLVGAVTAFVSNFFFSQGNWTPWQMFCFGIVGFVTGIVFDKGLLKTNRITLSVFGFLATMIIYGGIINFGNVLMYMPYPDKEAILLSYSMAFNLDLIHAFSTAFFLWYLSEPMIEKLDRVKNKYGLL